MKEKSKPALILIKQKPSHLGIILVKRDEGKPKNLNMICVIRSFQRFLRRKDISTRCTMGANIDVSCVDNALQEKIL